MFSLLIVLLIGLAAVIVFFSNSEQPAAPKSRAEEPEDGEWEYGDVWKQGSPDELLPEDNIQYVEILRGDTGMGYSDTTMQNFILALGSEGIRAKFESYPLEQINIYVLSVEAGKVDEAREYLREKFKVQGAKFKV